MGLQSLKNNLDLKNTRGLGLTRENWEEITGKKRKASLKTSNENITEETDPNFFIYKGEEVFQHFQLRSNKNVTIL